MQIDHVVALSDAWQKGAQQLGTPTSAPRFANDPLNLLAVDGPLNMQKGDGDAATWLPPEQGATAAPTSPARSRSRSRYGLWVTQAEQDAIATVLSTCPNQPLPGGVDRPDPQSAACTRAQASTRSSSSAGARSCASTSTGSCAPAGSRSGTARQRLLPRIAPPPGQPAWPPFAQASLATQGSSTVTATAWRASRRPVRQSIELICAAMSASCC